MASQKPINRTQSAKSQSGIRHLGFDDCWQAKSPAFISLREHLHLFKIRNIQNIFPFFIKEIKDQ
jgi:hypothetical protein